ncbi:MAG: M3 family oligoendopeptidase [Deltaproteobacteria bacterium]|nr:M3 family oligoendopeptidase [Deltaproteobacteria bacterium]
MDPISAEEVVWRLEDLYDGPDDGNLEQDKLHCIGEAQRLSSTFKGRIGELSPDELLEFLRDLENLRERSRKIVTFAHLHFATQTGNPVSSRLWQEAMEFNSRLQRDTIFFTLEWAQMDDESARRQIDSPVLAAYGHFLKSLRRYRPYLLTEPEERILAEKQPSGNGSWRSLFDKVMGRQRFGERRRAESEVLSDLYHREQEVRRRAAEDFTAGLDEISHVLTHIFNTILLDKSIEDRLRKHPHWLSARNLDNEIADEVVRLLVQSVTSRYDFVARYYRLKRDILGYEELLDYDRYAPLPGQAQTQFSWDQARDLVLSAFRGFSPRMEQIARRFFDDRWIHAPVMAGKRSGAFSHPAIPSVHPYILLNFTGKHRDIMTLAHELGHGIHQYLSRRQGLFNSEVPLTTAETASVFGEMLIFEHLLEALPSGEARLAALCTKLEDVIATIFRQAAMHRFEESLHIERREQGERSRERISEVWMETQRAMFGDSVRLLDHYGLWWSYIPHFVQSPGYVYAYAFGELLVFALIRRYREGRCALVPLYLELLESGGKASPEDLLRPLGIDLADAGFWTQGLDFLEELLREAERLAQPLALN